MNVRFVSAALLGRPGTLLGIEAFPGVKREQAEQAMLKDRDGIAKQDDPSLADAKSAEDASASVKREEIKEEELEEGLEESMPGSDAPASTRRSSEGR